MRDFDPAIGEAFWGGQRGLYVRAATGFKSSVYNTAVFGPGQFSIAKPESITDYEGGIKTQWLNDRLQINAAAYYYRYSGYQIQLLLGGLNTSYGNASAAEVKGLEFEINAQPLKDVVARVTAGYNDATFTDFADASVSEQVNSGLPLNVTGQRLPRSPRGTVSALLQYTVHFSEGDLRLQTDWNYVGKTNYAIWADVPSSSLTPDPAFATLLPAMKAGMQEAAYTLGNARIGYTFGRKRAAEIALWVKNITDHFYRAGRFDFFSLDTIGYQGGDPRTYGVTFSYKLSQ